MGGLWSGWRRRVSFSLAALWPAQIAVAQRDAACFALPLALFTGAVVGLGLKQLILVLLGLLLAPAVLLVPSRWLLTLMLFVATGWRVFAVFRADRASTLVAYLAAGGHGGAHSL